MREDTTSHWMMSKPGCSANTPHMKPTKPTTPLFTLRAQTVPPETWRRFTDLARMNRHSLAGLFRAFVLAYIRRGLGDAADDYTGDK